MDKKYVISSFTAFLIFGISTAFAQPNVTSVSGSMSHKGTIVVNGSGFGTKSPAAPKVWDACDNYSTSSMSTYYQGSVLPLCSDGNTDDPDISGMKTRYWTSYPDLGGTSMGMPHSRVTKYIAGATSTCNGSWSGSYACADTVFTVTNWTIPKLFAMYYYRVSPTFHIDDGSMGGHNMKEVSYNQDNTYLSGPDNYLDHCNNQTPVMMNPADAQLKSMPSGYSSPCSGGQFHYPNPMQGWVHLELLWDVSGNQWSHSNGSRSHDHAWSSVAGMRSNYQSVSIGGFTRWPLVSANGNYRYWAAMYLDNTYARVMLGNNLSWNNCTIREPQIPSAWSDGSTTCSVNLGAFPDSGTAYLFVFDADNNHNQVGYPVTIGGGGDTPPTVQITAPTSGSTYNTSESSIDIAGNASDDDSISAITWRNSRGGSGTADNDSGDWTSWSIDSISLQEGSNAITVTATDSASQTSTDTITVTYFTGSSAPSAPGGLGFAAWQATQQTGDTDWKDSFVTYCVRLLIDGSYVTYSGNTVRLAFQGRSSGDYTIRKVSIAERDFNGNQGDVIDSTWTRVTFDGHSEATWANDLVIVSAGAHKGSNPISFSLSPGKDYYVTFKIETPPVYLNPPSGYQELYFSTEDHTDDIDWSAIGYSTAQDYHALASIVVINP